MKSLLFICILFLLPSCQRTVHHAPIQKTHRAPITVREPLARIHVIDHHGLSETITNKERIKEFSSRNFFASQPYKKVLRIFAKDKQGSSKSILTSYYANGNIQQYLECLNGRAKGLYLEWHSNGSLKLEAHVLSGQADIDETAQNTWAFHGNCYAWNEDGDPLARFPYQHGLLEGTTETFYPTGEVKNKSHYKKGQLHGEEQSFYQSGSSQEITSYFQGNRHGTSKTFYDDRSIASQEEYQDNKLITGNYFQKDQTLISQVSNGTGTRSIFKNETLVMQQEIHEGQPLGWVTIFTPDGNIEKKYEINKEGEKHGTELQYYPNSSQVKISIKWLNDAIYGTIKTWYPDGTLESQKEMKHNTKQGIAMAWYPDGHLMLVEEYENNKLIRGKYHKQGEQIPISTIEKGSGIATLFDATGALVRKIPYLEGQPQAK